MRARLEAKDRGVADAAASLGPVLDDAERARMGEQAVDAGDDDEVEIEEQHRAAEIVELGREARQLAPAGVRRRIGQLDRRQGPAFDLGPDAGRIVGQADEAVRQREMARDHREQPVDVVRSIAIAPSHAEHASPAARGAASDQRRPGGCRGRSGRAPRPRAWRRSAPGWLSISASTCCQRAKPTTSPASHCRTRPSIASAGPMSCAPARVASWLRVSAWMVRRRCSSTTSSYRPASASRSQGVRGRRALQQVAQVPELEAGVEREVDRARDRAPRCRPGRPPRPPRRPGTCRAAPPARRARSPSMPCAAIVLDHLVEARAAGLARRMPFELPEHARDAGREAVDAGAHVDRRRQVAQEPLVPRASASRA